MNEQHAHPEELLPFYVNGSLDADEHQQVENHVAACGQCRDEIALLQSLQTRVAEIDAHTAPGEFGWQRLQRDMRKPARQTRRSWMKMALAASLLVVVVQSGWLLQLSLSQNDYIPAGAHLQQGVILQVAFRPQATASQIHQLLDAIDAEIVGGPGAAGVYRIRLHNRSEGDASQPLQRLNASTEVVEYVVRE